jgi:hypothetical protein
MDLQAALGTLEGVAGERIFMLPDERVGDRFNLTEIASIGSWSQAVPVLVPHLQPDDIEDIGMGVVLVPRLRAIIRDAQGPDDENCERLERLLPQVIRAKDTLVRASETQVRVG